MTKLANRLLLIDFDETLFNHLSYIDWVDGFLYDRFGINPGSFAKEIDDYHDIQGVNMRLYDHAGHIESVSGRSWAYLSGEIEAELAKEERDFCYPEAHKFIEYVTSKFESRLLTYGNGEYQRYKVRTCHLLTKLRIPIHVVNESKAKFLAREYGNIDIGALVDDKYPLDLPDNWIHIWIDRQKNVTDTINSKKEPKVFKISSLDEFTNIEETIFNI